MKLSPLSLLAVLSLGCAPAALPGGAPLGAPHPPASTPLLASARLGQAAPSLDLTPYVAALRPVVGSALGWSRRTLHPLPASLPETVEADMQAAAAKAFRALGCDGMARVDFFVTEDLKFLVNELNTIPGFTDISMYSKVMGASGVSYGEIIDRLVEHGLARGG